MQSVAKDTTGRELVFTRLLDAPVKLVWSMWTNPKHIALWWGPAGFTNTIQIMEVKPGGKWELIMHGPDGRNYDIKGSFREVVKERKIVYEHLNPFKYTATILFEPQGNKTYLYWQLLFDSKEQLVQAAKEYGVVEGLKQNGEKLVDYLHLFYDNENL